MKTLFLITFLVVLLTSTFGTPAEAASGAILRLETFRALTGEECLFVWGEGGRNFGISEFANVQLVIQPDTLPQEFHWVDGTGAITLKLHRRELAEPHRKLDISGFCN